MTACKYGDPLCPCQDGDECHYEGPKPINVPPEYVRNALSSAERRTVAAERRAEGYCSLHAYVGRQFEAAEHKLVRAEADRDRLTTALASANALLGRAAPMLDRLAHYEGNINQPAKALADEIRALLQSNKGDESNG